MTKQELQERTKAFALRVIKLVDSLPKKRSADILGTQLLRSSTSVAANYRAACRARSQAEFIAKMGVVEEESDESTGWIELIADAGLISRSKVESLLQESNELTAITVASIKTARQNSRGKQKP
jgi:four helix bundle protein